MILAFLAKIKGIEKILKYFYQNYRSHLEKGEENSPKAFKTL